MVRRQYCCDASQKAYENYYMNQMGSGLPVFIGSKGQRGHGLGSMLSGLFRSAMPIVKKGLSTIGKSALKTGLSIAGDVLEGKNAGEAARSRVAHSIKNFTNGGETDSQIDVRRGLSSLGKNALNTGLSIAGDVLEGKKAGHAAKHRIAQGIKRFANDDELISRPHRTAVKRSDSRGTSRHQKKKNKRRKLDIFD